MNIVGATYNDLLPDDDEFAHLREKFQRTRANVHRRSPIFPSKLDIGLAISDMCVQLNS